MLYRYLPDPLPRQSHAATRATTVYPESPRGRAIMAIGMLCVPLVSFGCVLAVYLILTV
jgi:hypothetical protein